MKIKKSNRKKGLMNKFLVPFAVFLGIVVICMYIIYRPQYKRLFLNNINVKMKTAAEEVSKWTSSFYSEIDIIEAYSRIPMTTDNMLNAFSNIVKYIAVNTSFIIGI